jgi:hypothetical protein
MIDKLTSAAVVAVLYCAGVSGQTIFGAAYDPRGSGSASLYTISPTTGAATLVGPMSASFVSAMAFAPDRTTLYAIGQTNSAGWVLLKVNTISGLGSVVGPTGLIGAFQDMDFRPSDGKLFGYFNGSIYTVSTTTGAATLVGYTGKFPDGNGLAFSSSNILYNANDRTLDVINQSNGSVTSSTPLTYSPAFGGGLTRANAMKFQTNGTLYASVVAGTSATRTYSLGIINVGTGTVAPVGPTVFGLDALAIPTGALSSTPAPSSWLLVSLGIVCVVVFQLIRRRSRIL